MYKPYPKYKESGVAWLGEVPEGWEMSKFKYIGKAIIGLTYSPSNITDKREGTLVLRSSNVQNQKIVFNDNVYVDVEVPKKLVTKENDILICSRNGSRALIGKNALIEKDSKNLTFGAFMTIFRSKNNNFVYWVLNSSLFKYQSGTFLTATINQLTTGNLNNFDIPFPPLKEQTQISNYLTQKTKKIDTLIKKQQSLIELLKEKRQALISHVVTKGLDDSVAMKDSGVEWLGEVPEHWIVLNIKRLCFVKRGASPRPIENPIYFDDNGEYAWVRISDVTLSDMYLEKTVQKLSALGKSLSVPLEPNDLFLSIAGSVGKPIIANIKCCIHDGFVYFQNYKEDLKFLYWVFKSGQPYLGLGKFGTQLNLNKDTVGDIKIALPPLKDQQKIANHLDQKTKQIDTLIGKSTKAIELLKERRVALISAVVTGKVDVRGK